jgi:hypothetical protein
MKVVTAAAAPIANGAVIETGFTNRQGVAIGATGASQYGSSTTASAAVT